MLLGKMSDPHSFVRAALPDTQKLTARTAPSSIRGFRNVCISAPLAFYLFPVTSQPRLHGCVPSAFTHHTTTAITPVS